MLIKKIAIRGGHNKQAPGAAAIIDEVTENRKVLPFVIQFIKMQGYDVLDVTPPHGMSASDDLAYGVQKANEWGADIFISLHFNKAYSHYEGKIGTEVVVFNLNKVAASIVKELSDLGFRNRGQKVRKDLYELRITNMLACIVEVCFVEATEDVKLYRELGADKVAQAIAKGITGTTVTYPPIQESKPVKIPRWSYKFDAWIVKLQNYLNQRGAKLKVDGIAGELTYNAIKGYTLSLNERATLGRLVQERLNSMGYNAGVVDGIVGKNTYAAINKFQKDNKLGVGFLGGSDWYYLIR